MIERARTLAYLVACLWVSTMLWSRALAQKEVSVAAAWWSAKESHSDSKLLKKKLGFAPCVSSTTYGREGPGLTDKQFVTATDLLGEDKGGHFGAVVHPHPYGIRDHTWEYYTSGKPYTDMATLWLSIVPYEAVGNGRRYLVPSIEKGQFLGYRVTCSTAVFETRFAVYPQYYPTVELTFSSPAVRDQTLNRLKEFKGGLELLPTPIKSDTRPATLRDLVLQVLKQQQVQFLTQNVEAGVKVQVRLSTAGNSKAIADFTVTGVMPKLADEQPPRVREQKQEGPQLSPIYLSPQGNLAQTLDAQGGLLELATLEGCETGGVVLPVRAGDHAFATDCIGAAATLNIAGLAPLARQADGAFRLTSERAKIRQRLQNAQPWPIAVATPWVDPHSFIVLQPGETQVLGDIPLGRFDPSGTLAIEIRKADEQDAHPCLSLPVPLGAALGNHTLRPLLTQDCVPVRVEWDAAWGAPKFDNCAPIESGDDHATCLTRLGPDHPILASWGNLWLPLSLDTQSAVWRIGPKDLLSSDTRN